MNFYKLIQQDCLQAECPSANHQHQIIQWLYIALKLPNLLTLRGSELELYLVCDVEAL